MRVAASKAWFADSMMPTRKNLSHASHIEVRSVRDLDLTATRRDVGVLADILRSSPHVIRYMTQWPGRKVRSRLVAIRLPPYDTSIDRSGDLSRLDQRVERFASEVKVQCRCSFEYGRRQASVTICPT